MTIAMPVLSAGALFTDDVGNVLLLKPTYKAGWEIPGGYAIPGESPLAACHREITEELGQHWTVGARPLVVDWAPSESEGDKLLFVFDGGVLQSGQLDGVEFTDGEISETRFVDPGEFPEYLVDRLVRRMILAVKARREGRTIYAEHGEEPVTSASRP